MAMANKLIPVFDSHGYSYEGGRKIHLLDTSKNKCLCGYHPALFDVVDLSYYKNLTDYMSQPDPDGAICQRCKKSIQKNITKQQ